MMKMYFYALGSQQDATDMFIYKYIYIFIFNIGSRGTFTGSSGLQIAYLSGVESSSSSCGPTEFDLEAVTSLTVPVVGDTKFKGVDILLTSQWPVGVEKYADDIVSCKFYFTCVRMKKNRKPRKSVRKNERKTSFCIYMCIYFLINGIIAVIYSSLK